MTAGSFAVADAGTYLVEGIAGCQCVAGIEKEYIVAGGTLEAFVHGVVDALVGFRQYLHLVAVLCAVVVAFVFLDNL